LIAVLGTALRGFDSRIALYKHKFANCSLMPDSEERLRFGILQKVFRTAF